MRGLVRMNGTNWYVDATYDPPKYADLENYTPDRSECVDEKHSDDCNNCGFGSRSDR
jgi:hypothetical protein